MRAIRCGAYAIVCAHNHPSGNVKPSEQDKLLARALSQAVSTLQISVVDHMIISADSYFSFREAGLL
ncbi:MAG: hypothetical protein JW795_02790 [Chitinivibrionales bacterium]|nr:hypothetical protein [Chitinivibrionales bacterium]